MGILKEFGYEKRDDSWREMAISLWKLLDDIDTQSDATKGDLEVFQHRALSLAENRSQHMCSDGQKLFRVTPEGLEAEPVEGS